MAMYWCSVCGNLIDNDYDPMDEEERCEVCSCAAEDEEARDEQSILDD